MLARGGEDRRATVARFGVAVPLAVAVLFAGAMPAFWPRYLSRVGSADAYTHVHAALGLSWLLLLGAQPLLARGGNFALHRALGRLGAAVGVAFVAASVLLTHDRVSALDAAELERFGHFMYLPLVMALLFASALLLALRYRRNVPLHARYMACTALALVDPVTSRLLGQYAPPLPADYLYQLPAFAIVTGTLAWLFLTLPRGQPGRGAFAAFAAASGALLAIFFALPGNAAWLAVIRGFRDLPLT